MARRLDFYFDCSSPWTYLAFHAVQPLAAELGAEICWKPILVGGVFNAVNQTVYDNRAKPNPLKQAYMLKDLADWARLYDLRIVFPPKVFPVNSVKCMRGAFHALDEGKLVPYSTAAFDLVEIRRGQAEDPPIFPGDIVVVDGSGNKALQKQILNTLPVLSIFRPF